MLADESPFEVKFDAAVAFIENSRKKASGKLTTALKFLTVAEDCLIEAAKMVDAMETGKDFDAIIRLEVKLEDIGCDLRSQMERMK